MIYGFTARNWKLRLAMHPNEESFFIDKDESIFAVADGVTRDPYLCTYVPNTDNFFGKLKFTSLYPRPSPAKIAADLFISHASARLKEYDRNKRDEECIAESFEAGNKEISRFRKRKSKSIDYLVDDYPGCTAALASVRDSVVRYGYIADTGIAIFSSEGNLRFKTENEGPEKYHEKIWQDAALRGLSWEDPSARVFIRSNYRNNPPQKNSFGVLTGQQEAMHYVKIGSEKLQSGETAVLYTDGVEPIILSDTFKEFLQKKDIKDIEKLCGKKVRTEGTLICAWF